MTPLIFGNGTDVVHWKPSCNTRGTFDIFSTCVITLLLCMWTAVHLNVPIPGSVWEQRLRKVGWLALALVAPEVVAYTAWYVRTLYKPLNAEYMAQPMIMNGRKIPGITYCRHQRQAALTIMRLVN